MKNFSNLATNEMEYVTQEWVEYTEQTVIDEIENMLTESSMGEIAVLLNVDSDYLLDVLEGREPVSLYLMAKLAVRCGFDIQFGAINPTELIDLNDYNEDIQAEETKTEETKTEEEIKDRLLDIIDEYEIDIHTLNELTHSIYVDQLNENYHPKDLDPIETYDPILYDKLKRENERYNITQKVREIYKPIENSEHLHEDVVIRVKFSDVEDVSYFLSISTDEVIELIKDLAPDYCTLIIVYNNPIETTKECCGKCKCDTEPLEKNITPPYVQNIINGSHPRNPFKTNQNTLPMGMDISKGNIFNVTDYFTNPETGEFDSELLAKLFGLNFEPKH